MLAAVLDPTSAYGVLKAIMSGMMAGHLIEQMVKDHQNEQNPSTVIVDGFTIGLRAMCKN